MALTVCFYSDNKILIEPFIIKNQKKKIHAMFYIVRCFVIFKYNPIIINNLINKFLI